MQIFFLRLFFYFFQLHFFLSFFLSFLSFFQLVFLFTLLLNEWYGEYIEDNPMAIYNSVFYVKTNEKRTFIFFIYKPVDIRLQRNVHTHIDTCVCVYVCWWVTVWVGVPRDGVVRVRTLTDVWEIMTPCTPSCYFVGAIRQQRGGAGLNWSWRDVLGVGVDRKLRNVLMPIWHAIKPPGYW